MLMEEFVQQFTKVRNYSPSHVNDLLDYLQKCYIFGELSIVHYKNLFSELNKLDAEKPFEYYFNPKQSNQEFEMPC